jgi:transposase
MNTTLVRTPDWQEIRRFRALELKRDGWTHQEVAEALGVSKVAVSKWMKAVREHGDRGLQARLHKGATPRLTPEQKALLPDYLSHGAEAYGFRGEVWTCARVATLIQREFGVLYHKAHVSRLLKDLQWTPQKPIARATQRDEIKIAQWREAVWPELLKQARRERRIIVFIDEAGFYLLPGVVRTYAPCGKTPILHCFQTRDHLSVMSGVTMTGQLYTLTRDEALTSAESIAFLLHLSRRLGRRLLVIWDGSPIHRSQEVKTFLAQGGSQLVHLESLPPYAPDLNPDEGVWQHLKHVELRNLCCGSLRHLYGELSLAIKRLRRKPHIVQSFFAGAGLAL